ncbi:MAG: VapC toxin family PIN domain ribonuclease [Sphingomonadales bacterium]|nr:VapC toxin family PIN domain ribonuclease [Sphingomonadales bacterium]
MIVVDTSVWIEHLRRGDPHLVKLLSDCRVLQHPFVTGELALGAVTRRGDLLEPLRLLEAPQIIEGDALLDFVDERSIAGRGIGLVDAHLLASTAATPGASLWTKDRRLALVAQDLGLAATHD